MVRTLKTNSPTGMTQGEVGGPQEQVEGHVVRPADTAINMRCWSMLVDTREYRCSCN
jgi:hypothetical protein